MTIVIEDLGQVAAMIKGSSAPSNTDLIWLDTNVDKHKEYDTTLGQWVLMGTGGSSSTPTDITHAALVALFNAETMIPGFYNITDYSDSGLVGQIIIQAISTSKLSLNGAATLIFADFQNVGDYDNLPFDHDATFGTNRGVWNSSMTLTTDPDVYDVVIWNGYHYLSITQIAGSEPDGDPTNWRFCDKTDIKVGYITETNYIEYDLTSNLILKIVDKRQNSVVQNDNGGLYLFQFGNDNVVKNNVEEEAVLSCLNSRMIIISNNLGINFQLTIDNTVSGNVYLNNLKGSINLILSGDGNFEDCSIDYGHLTVPSIQNIGLELVSVYSPPSLNSIGRFYLRNNSNFTQEIDITGLTDINFGTLGKLTGVVLLTSSFGSETITSFTNFPTNQSVSFFPKNGLSVTFDDGSAGFKNKTEDGPIAIDGTKHDWIEYKKGAAGTIIYEMQKGKYA